MSGNVVRYRMKLRVHHILHDYCGLLLYLHRHHIALVCLPTLFVLLVTSEDPLCRSCSAKGRSAATLLPELFQAQFAACQSFLDEENFGDPGGKRKEIVHRRAVAHGGFYNGGDFVSAESRPP